MESLNQIETYDRPPIARLHDYVSQNPPEINYYDYQGEDYFFELGEWLRDYHIRRRNEYEKQKKQNEIKNKVGL